jgi:origin recognition complex subunit 1
LYFGLFQFVELNGMWLTEPRQAYVQLLKALTGQTVTAEQAQQLLERRFSRTAHRRITTLLLVDEVISQFPFDCSSYLLEMHVIK